MTIVINGENRDLAQGIDLERLVNDLALPQKRIAVELNGSVIRRIDWPETRINEGDKIEVVHFVGGG